MKVFGLFGSVRLRPLSFHLYFEHFNGQLFRSIKTEEGKGGSEEWIIFKLSHPHRWGESFSIHYKSRAWITLSGFLFQQSHALNRRNSALSDCPIGNLKVSLSSFLLFPPSPNPFSLFFSFFLAQIVEKIEPFLSQNLKNHFFPFFFFG